MGFPLRSNIFKSGTNEQAYFARFPIQVAVLFSPNDDDFVQIFKDVFLDLDRLTGEYVAFFAVLDPPQNWIDAARGRDWWRDYQVRIGQSGFSMDNRVLVREIARLFGVPWHALPALVVGTDLWMGEFVTSGTSPYHIKQQLETLTKLAQEWGRPNIDHIAGALGEIIGFEVEYHPPDDELRFRLDRMYSILGTAVNPDVFNRDEYQRLLANEFRTVEDELRRVRRIRGRQDQIEVANQATDIFIEDIAGRLVAPATVATKVFRNLRRDVSSETLSMLDEESLVMAETALTVGAFLEGIAENRLEGIAPIRFSNDSLVAPEGRRLSYSTVDFTPGAQGAWKAFELEINLSLIQAARASRTVKMPDLFALFDSGLPKERGKVQTGADTSGRKVYKDINQKDNRRTGRHRFLTLGDAWHVSKVMSSSSMESFNSVIATCLGGPLPREILAAWQHINLIRNKASHTQPLHMSEYAIVLRTALSPQVLHPLMEIKRKLSGRQ